MPPPRRTTEARSGSLEPGRPSRARSANTRHPAGRPHTPPADRMYATDVRQTSDVRERETSDSIIAQYPLGGGINNLTNITRLYNVAFSSATLGKLSHTYASVTKQYLYRFKLGRSSIRSGVALAIRRTIVVFPPTSERPWREEEYLFRQQQKQLQYEHNVQTQSRVSRRAITHRAGHPQQC